MPAFFNDCDKAAQQLIADLGKTIVLGIPLGLGKPIGLVNALYRAAEADSSIMLTIITGLTLSRPSYHNELERRFIEPLLNRLLKDFEDPLYEKAREQQNLPKNIRVIEFFLSPGKYLHNNYVQQNYINSNYTTVARDTLNFGINVIAQLVAHSTTQADNYSLSSNTDLFLEVVRELQETNKNLHRNIAIIGEVNQQLPFMYGDAIVKSPIFTHLIDTKTYKNLFAMPSYELSLQDHLIGFYSSCLVKDGGCLQIGIGKLSNAASNALILRHKSPETYQAILQKLQILEKFGTIISKEGGTDPFIKGLYASTEMFSDGYLHLFKEGILKKRVYDHIPLQGLLNDNVITDHIDKHLLSQFLTHRIIQNPLTDEDIFFLQGIGLLPEIINTNSFNRDIANPSTQQAMLEPLLGQQLKNGKVLHGGFYLGTADFYQALRDLTPDELVQIDMTAIARTNLLSWNPVLLRLQRQHARFINSAMMITAGGVAISDGLKDLQEVSGVGGQFDFIDMAHKLKGGRSIINCPSTRDVLGSSTSNIVWSYPNVTIPRYLRDIVITEYGIADCRSKTDCEVIQTMLNVTDSRFQPVLLAIAKKTGKLNADYEIPQAFRNNYPEKLAELMQEFTVKSIFAPFPFGTELTPEEIALQHALLYLKLKTKFQVLLMLCLSFFTSQKPFARALERMQYHEPVSGKSYIYKQLVLRALYETRLN